MSASKNLIGQVFGRLTVTGKSWWRDAGQVCWVCVCSCPLKNTIVISTARLNRGNTQSCGCLSTLSRQKVGRANALKTRKHGLCITGNVDKSYTRWFSIKDRCYNRNNIHYKNYGGRGIIMWEGWIDNLVAFVEYIKSLPGSGNPKLSLDRIDNNGNYEPGNLQWATRIQQANNTRRNITQRQIECVEDKLKSSFLSHIAIGKLFGMSPGTVVKISKNMKVQALAHKEQ